MYTNKSQTKIDLLSSNSWSSCLSLSSERQWDPETVIMHQYFLHCSVSEQAIRHQLHGILATVQLPGFLFYWKQVLLWPSDILSRAEAVAQQESFCSTGMKAVVWSLGHVHALSTRRITYVSDTHKKSCFIQQQ